MKIEVNRYFLNIVPENVQDEAWIEEVLGLKHNGERCAAIRVNAMNLSCIAYVRLEADKSLNVATKTAVG